MQLTIDTENHASSFKPIEAVPCADLFADEIAAEEKAGDEYGFFTQALGIKTFTEPQYYWFCPNITNYQIQNDARLSPQYPSKLLISRVISCEQD